MAATLTHKCSFSGFNVYPGWGQTYIRADGKSFTFANSKTQSFHHKKRNPRKISWTQAYRIVHKKGITVATARKRARRTTKVQRAIVGASIEQIKAKATQKPEFRIAQREAAKREAKQKAKELRDKRKAAQKAAGARPKQTSAGGKAHAGKGR